MGMFFVVNIHFNNDTAGADEVAGFDLTSPYDISTCSYVSETTNLDLMKHQNGSQAGSRGSGTSANKEKNRVQGIEFNDRPAFSFQGHPEASPGPQEIQILFEKFKRMVEVYAKT